MAEYRKRSEAAAIMAPEREHVAPRHAVAPGDVGDHVEQVYRYLQRFGYFPNSDLAARHPWWRSAMAFDPPDPRVYDEQLKTAVSLFQKMHGLETTGNVDDATLHLMNKPRCGCPDVVAADGDGTPARFVAQGSRWTSLTVNYSLSNTTPELSVDQVNRAVRDAFDRWSAVSPLTFVESAVNGDMQIDFFSGNHGDGSDNSFDGVGGVLAHCYYPPPSGGSSAGDCHFDEAETWSVTLPPAGTDLPTVALHEFGHGIGLNHSAERSAVMFASYDGPRRELTEDDIAGVRSVYGTRPRWTSLVAGSRIPSSRPTQTAGWRCSCAGSTEPSGTSGRPPRTTVGSSWPGRPGRWDGRRQARRESSWPEFPGDMFFGRPTHPFWPLRSRCRPVSRSRLRISRV